MSLFDESWMRAYQVQWNAEPALKDALAEISFNTVIGYGFVGHEMPAGFIAVTNGECTEAGVYDGRLLNWDLRAKEKNWNRWLAKDIGMAGLGLAFSTGALKFKKGNFSAMISNPRMAGPFIKSFAAMGRV